MVPAFSFHVSCPRARRNGLKSRLQSSEAFVKGNPWVQNRLFIILMEKQLGVPKCWSWNGALSIKVCTILIPLKSCVPHQNIFRLCTNFSIPGSFVYCIVPSFISVIRLQVLPLDLTTPRDSYAWNHRDLATLLTLSESLAEAGFEPLTIGS